MEKGGKRTTKFKTILPIALVTLLCLFIAPCAFAEETAEVSEPVTEEIVPQAETPVDEQVIESEESNTGETLNDVKYVKYLGRTWMVIGFNGEGCGSKAGTMTLLKSDIIKASDDEDFICQYTNKETAENILYTIFGADNNNNYSQSKLKEVMDAYYGYLENNNPEDASMISTRTLKDEDFSDISPYCDGVAGDAVEAMVWPLSTAEAASLAGGVQTANDITAAAYLWWLRSPGGGDYNANAALVFKNGYVEDSGNHVSTPLGVRPALWINLESVSIGSGEGTKDNPYVLGKNAADPGEDQTAGVGVTAVSVYIDGELLNYGEDYVFVNGKVQLTSAFLKTLGDGNHTLEIRYDGGYSVSGTIEVKNGEIVKSEYKYPAA